MRKFTLLIFVCALFTGAQQSLAQTPAQDRFKSQVVREAYKFELRGKQYAFDVEHHPNQLMRTYHTSAAHPRENLVTWHYGMFYDEDEGPKRTETRRFINLLRKAPGVCTIFMDRSGVGLGIGEVFDWERYEPHYIGLIVRHLLHGQPLFDDRCPTAPEPATIALEPVPNGKIAVFHTDRLLNTGSTVGTLYGHPHGDKSDLTPAGRQILTRILARRDVTDASVDHYSVHVVFTGESWDTKLPSIYQTIGRAVAGKNGQWVTKRLPMKVYAPRDTSVWRIKIWAPDPIPNPIVP